MPKALPTPYRPTASPEREEAEMVHEVYEAIAPHFSQTRQKPWPLITNFLRSLPRGSFGLDSGAGNGKYLPPAWDAGHEVVALDRSTGLLGIAMKQPRRSRKGKERAVDGVNGMGECEGEGEETVARRGEGQEKGEGGWECVRADLAFEGWRRGVFDFAISIAAIHHLSTRDRRRRAVQALLTPLRLSSAPPYSKLFIYVWAYEQSTKSKRKMGARSFSPSTTIPDSSTSSSSSSPLNDKAIGSGGQEDGGMTSLGGQERVQDVLVPWVYSKPKGSAASEKGAGEGGQQVEKEPQGEDGDKVYHRYYHLFLEGELEQLVRAAAAEEGFRVIGAKDEQEAVKERGKWLRITGVGWEMDNWWLEAEVGMSSGTG